MSSYTEEELERWGLLDRVHAAANGEDFGTTALATMDLAALAGVEPAPVRFIVDGLLPADKTTLSLMIAAAMAARLDNVLGMAIEPGPAAYIGMEDSEARLHWTLHHICGGLGLSMLDIADRLHVVSMRQIAHNGLASFGHDGELKPAELYHMIEQLVRETGSKLLVLDNLAHLFLGNENDRMQATRFLSLINKLASDTDAAIMLLAHTPKSGADFSGSTGWQNATRSHASIEKEENGDPDVRVLKVSKGNYVRPGEVTRFRWHDHYLIKPEDLPNDIAATLAATSRATAANDAFLRCLAAVTKQGRAVSDRQSPTYAPRVFSRMPEAKNFDEEDFAAAMERLLHLGVIRANEVVGKYANRTDRRGLKAVETGAQEHAQKGAQDAQNPSHNMLKMDARSTPPPSGEGEGDYGPPSPPFRGVGVWDDDSMPGDD